MPVAAIGSTVRVLASGIGDTGGPVAGEYAILGGSVRPPNPAQARLATVDDTPTLSWTRRSRAGFRWIDGSEVPLVEENEAYRVTITPLIGAGRDVMLAERACPLDPAEAVSGTTVEVRQIGTFGESPPTGFVLP